MVARNKDFFHTARILLLGAPLFLTACHSDFGPYPMPSGYTYLDRAYKAPPGPEPVFKKLDHSTAPQSVKPGAENCPPETAMSTKANMTNDMAPPPAPGAVSSEGEWGYAASDLIRRLVDGFGQPTEAIYLTPGQGTAAEMNIEKALRSEMAARGFNVATAPGMGPYTLDYHVQKLGIGDGSRSMVTITLNNKGEKVTEESGIYTLGGVAMAAPPQAMMAPPDYHESEGGSPGAPVPLSPAP